MKNLLDVLNKNLGKNYKTCTEFKDDLKNADAQKIAISVIQYISYQEGIDKVNMEKFKPIMFK